MSPPAIQITGRPIQGGGALFFFLLVISSLAADDTVRRARNVAGTARSRPGPVMKREEDDY